MENWRTLRVRCPRCSTSQVEKHTYMQGSGAVRWYIQCQGCSLYMGQSRSAPLEMVADLREVTLLGIRAIVEDVWRVLDASTL